MRLATLLLRAGSVVFLIVAGLHLVLGLQADILLGARVPPEVVRDPVLDSQNRFYGTTFALYGVLLLLAATNIRKYEAMLRCCLWCFFAGGVARLVSIAAMGLPSEAILGLIGLELMLPPIAALWLRRVAQAAPEAS